MKFFLGSLFILLFLNFSGSGVNSLEVEVGLKPNYTSIQLNVSYRCYLSPKEIYDGFVKGYYKFVNVIVNLILPDALPDGLFTIEPGETLLSHIWTCIWAYRRLLIFVIMLIIQIIFLIGSSMHICCSCLFSCTNRYTLPPSRSKRKFSKLLWLGWIYTALSLLLMMLVLANQSNQNMDDGINTVILTLDDVIEDIGTYMDTTIKQLKILLLTNLQEYFNFFLQSGERATAKILDDLLRSIASLDFSKIFNEIVDNFKIIKPIFDEIEAILIEVEKLGKTINKEIAELKHLVENMVCDTKECEKLKNLIPSLETIYDGGMDVANETYAELEDLHRQGKETINGGLEHVENLTSFIGGEAMKEGKALGKLTSKIAGNVENLTSDIGGKVLEEGKALQNLTTNIAGHAIKDIEKTGKDITNLTGNVIGGIGKEIKNGGKALGDLTEKVTGGVVSEVGNVAGGLVDVVDDTLKDHDDSSEKKKSKKTNPTTESPTTKRTKKPDIIDNVASGIGSIFDSPGKVSPGKEAKVQPESTTHKPPEVRTETINIVDSFGNSNPKKKVGIEESTMDLTSYLNEDKNNNNREMDTSSTSRATTKPPEVTTEKGVIENIASGVSKGAEKVQNVASEVVGGVENTVNEVGDGLLGGLKRKRRSTNNVEKISEKNESQGRSKIIHDVIEESQDSSKECVGKRLFKSRNEEASSSKSSALVKGNPNKPELRVSKGAKKEEESPKCLTSKGMSGLRKKRETSHNFDLKEEFEMIFGTIDTLEKFIMHDLKSLNNMTVLLSPAIKEIQIVIKDGLVEIKNEVEEAARPIENLFTSALDKIISIEKTILNATHVIKDAQVILSWFEGYRYYISNFIAAALLISFILLIVSICLRMVCNNVTTKVTYNGGFTLLHLAALLMAITSLVYIGVGVTTQKVLCDTLDTNHRENNIMKILSSINPAEYGLILDLNLHKIIIRCHQDKSLYEVTALKSILDLEKIAKELLDTKSIEKEFEPLIGLQLNFSKFLPFDIIQNLDADLNFDAFDKLLDSPIFSQIEQLEKEFTNIPLVGPTIKTISEQLDIFKDKVKSLKAPVKTAHSGFTSFFSNLKRLLTKVENMISEIEKQTLETIQNVVLQIKKILLSSLMDYVHNRLINSIQKKVGKCKPISAAFNTTLNSVCQRITTPANGHWFSWFIGVFIAIILIVLSRIVDGKLNKLGKYDKKRQNNDDIELKTINANKFSNGSAGIENKTDA